MSVEIRDVEIGDAWVLSLNKFNGPTRVREYGEKGVKIELCKVRIGFLEPSIWYK